jgi:hypothetical protein
MSTLPGVLDLDGPADPPECAEAASDCSPVMAIDKWASNADLIADCARLGYLRSDWMTLDPTYGYGTFWRKWHPPGGLFVRSDLDPRKSPVGYSVDFTNLPFQDRTFDAVVFDPPYKLNGTPSDTDGVDERYGVHGASYFRWEDRMQLCRDGISECARVLGDGYLLVKCQDQVCSGKVRWQTIDFANHAATLGLGLVDRFDFLSYRAQPAGRRQVHARRNASTLLVFKRGWGL